MSRLRKALTATLIAAAVLLGSFTLILGGNSFPSGNVPTATEPSR